MQISYQTFFCITFLTFVFSAPLEKDEKNEDPSNTTNQSNKVTDTPSLENNTVTSKTILHENNNENNNEINESISNNTKQESQKIQLHLEKKKEHIGNEENEDNGEKEEVKSRNKENPEEATKNEEKKEEEEKRESKKENKKKEKSGKPPKKKVSSDLNFILKNHPFLPNMRSYFTDSKIEDSEENIKNKLSDEEDVHQGQKKRCKCTKRNERKETRLGNDDISQISSDINPDLDSKMSSLSKKTRRNNSGDGPKYFGEKKTKKKKKCRRKKKKKIDPIEEDESIDTDQFENLSADSYVDSAYNNHNVNENININKNINHYK